jgi:hypothetical protein
MLLRAQRLFDSRTPKVFRDWVVEVEDGPVRERRQGRMPVMSLILAM